MGQAISLPEFESGVSHHKIKSGSMTCHISAAPQAEHVILTLRLQPFLTSGLLASGSIMQPATPLYVATHATLFTRIKNHDLNLAFTHKQTVQAHMTSWSRLF